MPLSPFPGLLAPLALFWRQRALLRRLTWREIVGRYRGSFLGLLWSFATPLVMLGIYTFVFGVVFKARWSAGASGSQFDFALALFAGLIVFNLFAEVVARAPGLVVANPNYVKKVVFPLELLPLVALGAALFHACASFSVLFVALAATGQLTFWVLALPCAVVPLALLILGVAWLLAALGVFLRDIGQVTGMAVTALLFLSPVFYPASALPAALQPWLFLNPLTVPIEVTRAVVIDGRAPDWGMLGFYTLVAAAVAGLGFIGFEKTRKGFADVL